MGRHQHKKFWFVILLFSSSLSYAEISDESLDRILVLSGLTKQFDQLPGIFKASMNQAKQKGTPIPEALYDSIGKSMVDSFLPSKIIGRIRGSLRKSITEEDAKQLLVWYESDLGKEITSAEISASTPEAHQQLMQNSHTLLANSERVNFAKRIDELIGSTDMLVGIQKYTGIAVNSAIMTAMHPESHLKIESLMAQMDASSANKRAEIEQKVTILYLYSYQKIGTDKLKKYEAFLNQPSTMKLNKVIIKSMNKGFELLVSKWADALALMFKNKGHGS
jgi:hypothetical protein